MQGLFLKSSIRRQGAALSRSSICAHRALLCHSDMRFCTSAPHSSPNPDDFESVVNQAKIAEARKRTQERKAAAALKRQQEEEEAARAGPEAAATESSEQPVEAEVKKEEPVKAEPRAKISLSKEFQHAKEYLAKFSGPRRERKRIAEDVKATKERWQAGELLKRKKSPEISKQEVEEVDLSLMTKEERDEYEAKLQKEQEEIDRINATPLVAVEDSTETVWDQRIAGAKEWFRRTRPVASLRKLRRTAALSDNPVLQQARDYKDDMADNISDIKEFYGTTQHPVISKLRDGVDNVAGETETGWAIGQLRRVDPGFEIQLFLEDMEDYMIPLVIEAYLKGDMVVMSTVMEEKAEGYAFATCRERQVQGHTWDTRILNIDHLDFQGASVENDIPYVLISFVCQHVHCIKDKKGAIVEGHTAEVKSVYYAWKMRRDLENPDFDWKIVEMHSQRIFSLVG